MKRIALLTITVAVFAAPACAEPLRVTLNGIAVPVISVQSVEVGPGAFDLTFATERLTCEHLHRGVVHLRGHGGLAFRLIVREQIQPGGERAWRVTQRHFEGTSSTQPVALSAPGNSTQLPLALELVGRSADRKLVVRGTAEVSACGRPPQREISAGKHTATLSVAGWKHPIEGAVFHSKTRRLRLSTGRSDCRGAAKARFALTLVLDKPRTNATQSMYADGLALPGFVTARRPNLQAKEIGNAIELAGRFQAGAYPIVLTGRVTPRLCP